MRAIGPATLYLGDARDIVPTLAPADLGITDPPYRLTSGGLSSSPRSMKGAFSPDAYDNKGVIAGDPVTWQDAMETLHCALRTDADAYVFTNDKNVHPALDAAFSEGFRQHNILVWDKGRFTVGRWYCKDCEFVLYLFKGKARALNFPGSRQRALAELVKATRHPAEKPVALLRHYIRNSSQPGDVVIDPFMGSGSTGVACLWEGRKFIGIESDPYWFGVACDRLEKRLRTLEAA